MAERKRMAEEMARVDALVSRFKKNMPAQACPNVWMMNTDKSMRELAKTGI